MDNLKQYLTENIDELVFELKGETYLNAAKKAKKYGDPRAEKFLQAYKDNIDKEFADSEGPDKEDDKIAIYYNADKKAIQRLKGLAKNEIGQQAHVAGTVMGKSLSIQNDEIGFFANVYIATDKDDGRCVFLRQSLIEKGGWPGVSKKFAKIGDKINSVEAMKPFTYVRVFTNAGAVEFFYMIDSDTVIPTSYRTDKKTWKDDDCFDNYTDQDKKVINTLCTAINSKHKDI